MTAPLPAESKHLKWALRYVQTGWFVFPCAPRGKLPLISRDEGGQGFKDATRNEKQVREWWTKWPDANIGIRPGPSKAIAADLDGPECEKLAMEFGLLRKPTLTCNTGRADGGRHLYYKLPPGLIVGNVLLGAGIRPVKERDGVPYILFRGHDGYTVAPPSIHPDTGKEYRWEGSPADPNQIGELPAEVIAVLRAIANDTLAAAATSPGTAIASAKIKEGSRNNHLTQVAGSLLAKHKVPEATELLWGYNLANCDPPYNRGQCEQIIVNLSKREAKKPSRLTDTGHILAVASEPPPAPEMPQPIDLSIQHTEGAIAEGRVDHSSAPRWEWDDLHELVGPMLPGNFIVVPALTGNGKTSFLLSELDYLARRQIPTVYMPLEVDPSTMMRKRAAWELGLDWEHVSSNDWGRLPVGAKELHEAKIREHGKQRHIQMPPDKKLSLPRLRQWVEWGIREIGARVVIVDHIHRTDPGGAAEAYRITLTDAIRAVKDLGREHGVAIVAAAQLNRTSDPLDRYTQPHLSRIKETGALAEEADYVLMLSRRLRSVISREDVEAIKQGHRDIRDFADENVMVATCRKHRVRDYANDRHVKLLVQDGHVRSMYQGPARIA